MNKEKKAKQAEVKQAVLQFAAYQPGARQQQIPQPMHQYGDPPMRAQEQKDEVKEEFFGVQCLRPRLCFHGDQARAHQVQNQQSDWFGQIVHVCSKQGWDTCGFWEPDSSEVNNIRCMCGKPAKRGVSRSGKYPGRGFITCAWRRCKRFAWLPQPPWEQQPKQADEREIDEIAFNN